MDIEKNNLTSLNKEIILNDKIEEILLLNHGLNDHIQELNFENNNLLKNMINKNKVVENLKEEI